jgi:hypothetical protein
MLGVHDNDSADNAHLNEIGEELVEEPAVEELVEEPAVEELVEEPAVEELVEEPAVEELVEEPAVEELVEEPAVEELVEEPAVEELVEEPAVEELVEEPAVEEPATEELNEAQEKSGVDKPETDEKLHEGVRTERQIKGDRHEEAVKEFLDNTNLIRVYDGEKTHGFDGAFYNPDDGKFYIYDAKDFGSEEHVGYVNKVSSFSEDRLGANFDKLLMGLNSLDNRSEKEQNAIYGALGNGDVEFLVVGGDSTRMTENRQSENFSSFQTLADLRSQHTSARPSP